MERISIPPRQNWSATVEKLGYDFYDANGIPTWTESAYYRFTSAEVDEVEAAANKLHEMCLAAIEHVVSQKLYPLMGIDPDVAPLITKSWTTREPSIYGRFDFLYDGKSPPKLLEYNADTPTTLFESSIVQWQWKGDCQPKADQFNSIHEALVARWRSLLVGRRNANSLHVTCATPLPEDEATVQYIGQTAKEAGYTVTFLPIQEIGWADGAKCFVDLADKPMTQIFKLYPWEWLVRDSFGANIGLSGALFLEPAWKMLLSTKALLPLLWELYPEHPNLLPAFTTEDALRSLPHVRKPLLGREGSNIMILDGTGKVVEESPGEYDKSGYIYQAYSPAPVFDGHRPNVGVWIVGDAACGMIVREDTSAIIKNTSSCVPHVFE